MIVAILLAAGQGSRLGGPKALLLVRDPAAPDSPEMPLIEAQCRDRLAAESDRVLAVLRPDTAALVAARLQAAGAEVVVSHAPDALGPAGSLAAAAAHLGASADVHAVVVTPVDVRTGAAAVRALVDVVAPASGEERARTTVTSGAASGGGRAPHEAAPDEPAIIAAVPRFQGRKGHPVVLHPAALARYREGEPPPLREHLRGFGERVVVVDVEDSRVAEDLDFAHQTDMLLRITGMSGPARFFGDR